MNEDSNNYLILRILEKRIRDADELIAWEGEKGFILEFFSPGLPVERRPPNYRRSLIRAMVSGLFHGPRKPSMDYSRLVSETKVFKTRFKSYKRRMKEQ